MSHHTPNVARPATAHHHGSPVLVFLSSEEHTSELSHTKTGDP